MNTGDTYHKKGFSKLAWLKEAYANESELALAMKMFGFFADLSQGDDLLVVSESKLCHAHTILKNTRGRAERGREREPHRRRAGPKKVP